MPEALTSVTKAWNICANRAACRGLLAKVLLNHIVTMDTVLGAKVEVKVGRSLVQVHISKRAAGETGIGIRLPCKVVRWIWRYMYLPKVCWRYKRQEAINRPR